MQKHMEFQVVTPRTLTEFKGETLVLPDVRILSDAEKSWLQQYVAGGRKLVVTGVDATQFPSASNVIRIQPCPGKQYMAALESDFEHTSPDSQAAFLQSVTPSKGIQIEASSQVATSVAVVDGSPHIFLANFAGLRGGVNPVQTVQTGVRISVSAETKGRAHFLPFMGQEQELEAVRHDGTTSFTLPPISKGAVFWYEPAQTRP